MDDATLHPAARAFLERVIDDKGALFDRSKIILLPDSTRNTGAEGSPANILASEEIVKNAHLSLQNLPQLRAITVNGLEVEQRPNQQSA